MNRQKNPSTNRFINKEVIMRKQKKLFPVITFLLFIGSTLTSWAQSNPPMMRYPDIHENQVVFVSGGDIWMASTTGESKARRLTIHDGEERHPNFSPDGSHIAFTGEYDGNADVYVMNAEGGNITRLTFHPGFDAVVGWHPTQNKVLFSARRSTGTGIPTTRLYTIGLEGGHAMPLVLAEAAHGSYSPRGDRIVFNKTAREDRTWKRYRGGRAQELYLYDLEENKEQQLTHFEGTDRLPMWVGDKVYFASDRDGHLNVFSVETGSGETQPRQLTSHDRYDARRVNAGPNKVVYEHAGDIWYYDTRNGQNEKIDIQVGPDAPEARPRLVNVKDHITGLGISPHGERALVEARGEIFTVPRQHGPIHNLTQSSGAHDKDPAWSPDGRKVAYLSDASGEYEIHIIDARGEESTVQLTNHQQGYRHTLRWSPNGSKIAFTDQKLTLYYLDVDTREIAQVDQAEYESVDVPVDEKPIYDFRWSPDSRYLAYSKMTEKQVFQVFIYSLEEGKAHNVSQNLFFDFHPVFTPDGNHLLFISNRTFDPTFGDLEWEMVYKDVARLYSMTLEKDGEPFLPFRNNEASDSQGASAQKENGSGVQIDFEGLSGRVEELPLPASNYRYLSVNDHSLFFLDKEDGDFNRFEFREVGTMDLHAFDFDKRSSRQVIASINGYNLSEDGSHIAYKKGSSVGIISSNASDSQGHELDLSNLEMHLDPRKEWQQIFYEAWRMERDFYYESGMHGADWEQMREKYARLLPRATSREDVRYIIGELIGELNTSHTYIFGGEKKRQAESVDVGMLGADYQLEEASNRYRFSRILRKPDWSRSVMAPLDRPGMNIEEGDYLLAVNGQQVSGKRNIFSYFQGLAGEQMRLTVHEEPSMEGAREITVEPIRGERSLRYINWVERNRKTVDRLSNGKIGYIHFPDTYMGSATHFPGYFYSQLRKDGLIIDGRFNGGGLDPYIFLQRLNTKPLAYWTRRYSHDQTIPSTTVNAHMVCLTNKYAGSGGDMLPFEFRELGMGPVIGTRTWGGLVGVSQFIPLIDGGILTAPDYRIYDKHGNWIIENEGVTPDTRVELNSLEMSNGKDAQLREGIEQVLEQIKQKPLGWPRHKDYLKDPQAH